MASRTLLQNTDLEPQTRVSRTTIRDIAARAGVSAMTVSRVLRSREGSVSAGASEATAQRILALAREMNYIAVRPTLQNTHISTRVVGVVFDGMDSVKNFVGSHTFEGLRDEAVSHGFDLLLHAYRGGGESSRCEEASFLDRRTDGVIFISPRERRPLLEALVTHRFPVVTCFSSDVPEGVASITPDNHRAMREAVAYLYGRGHRRIALFAGPEWHSDARERREEWQKVMCEHGLHAYSHWIESSQGETARHISASKKVLALRPTAVVCHNDYRALLLAEAAQARGMDVPRDISIMGMDNVPESSAHGLTTLRIDFEALGHAAMRAVVAMIEGTPHQEASKRLHASLIERRSVADICAEGEANVSRRS